MYLHLIGLCYCTPSNLREVFVIVQLWNVTEVINEIAVMIVTVSFIYSFCLKTINNRMVVMLVTPFFEVS